LQKHKKENTHKMILTLGDLIADVSLRIEAFPVTAGDLHRVEYIEIGPGGAANVAISAARFGLKVACLGELGEDHFGQAVLEALRMEGIDISYIHNHPKGSTPVAGVIVDQAGEPAYLGFPGEQHLTHPPQAWLQAIEHAEAVFADGWVESKANWTWLLEGLDHAHASSVPVFFDPGPGNPQIDNSWHLEAIRLSTVLLATEDEARKLTGLSDPLAPGRALQEMGPDLVVIKRGAAGCLLIQGDDVLLSPGFPVEALDATGAGDSLAAAVIYGVLKELPLAELGSLANATGAAKVLKLGTGRNVPFRSEIEAVLNRFHIDSSKLFMD
jgi:sugar/nucleoside kinase (ribokinase family)